MFMCGPGFRNSGGPQSDPYYSSVVALLHMTGTTGSTTFTDQKGSTWTASGSAAIQATPTKWGGGSGAFNGTNAYLTTPTATAFNLTSGDFTIEAWINPSALTSQNQQIVQKDGVFGSSFSQYGMILTSAGKLGASLGTGNGTTSNQSFTGTTTIATNAWTHVAVTRQGTTVRGFVNGNQEWSTAQTSTMADGAKALYIGYQSGQPAGSYFTGALNDVRITKGVARYTASFTPPAAQFPNM